MSGGPDRAGDVAIVMAMGAEAEPVIERLGLVAVDAFEPGLPTRWAMGEVAGRRVVMAVNGVDPTHGVDSVGTVPAALSTHATIRRFSPSLIVSAGTAGAWAGRGAAIGDVVFSGCAFVFHDRRIALPGFDRYGIGRWPGIDTAELAEALGLRCGTVTTSDSLDAPEVDAAAMAALGADLKDMEAAAVAYVASLHGVPVMAVKAVTDLVDDPSSTAEQFVANLTEATERLAEVLARLVPLLPAAPADTNTADTTAPAETGEVV